MKKIPIGENLSATTKTFPYLWWFVFAIFFISFHYYIIHNAFLLSQDLLSGDHSGEEVRPAPQYPFLRIPDALLAREYQAYDRLAGDFAQIYFPLKKENGLAGNYTSGESDPWSRPSRIAPLIHYLCAKTYCKLKYGPASLVHLYLQLALFYIALIAAFVSLKIARSLPFGILLVNVGLFLTPAGLAWFERGQYSLYVAMAYLFIMMGILNHRSFYFLLGGLFAFIKWTSFPTIFVMIVIYLLASGNFQKLKSKILIISPFPAVILLLFSFFPGEGYYFVQGLLFQEAFIPPGGVSLVSILPVTYVKLLPVVVILLGIPYIRKYGEDFAGYIPYFAAASILLLTYPSVAFEYSLSTLFCFIPLILYWSRYRKSTNNAAVLTIMGYTFLGFLVIASNSPFMAQIFKSRYTTYWEYVFISAIFLFVPLLPSFHKVGGRAALQAA